MGRWIGIDYGTRRVGIALADPRGRIASPATQLSSAGSPPADAEQVLRWAADHDPGGFVVGLPRNMDGTDSRQTRITRAFAASLQRQTTLPVELWDERLSSLQANQHLAAAKTRRVRRQDLRDALAAQVILQSFLDARRSPDDDEASGTPSP